MSWQATEAVMQTSRATGSARLVLMVMATFADEQAEAWPSAETVAERAALSERQTRTVLAGLVKAGELIITRPGGGRQTTTKYLLPHLAWLETLQSSADTLRPTAPLKPANRGQFGQERVQSGVNTLQSGAERVQFQADTLRPTAPEPRTTNRTIEPPRTDARENAAPVLAEGFELIEVPEQQAADAASAQQPDLSPDVVPASPEPEPGKATSKTHVPRRAGLALPAVPADLAAVPGMPEAWADWMTYRRQRRWTTAPMTVTGMFAKLRAYAAEGDNPVEVIQNSIANGWQGLFPAEKPRNLKFPSRPQPTEAADARALHTAQAVYAALQEEERLAF
ncbi:helix-turn-helix domain-containing protein [Deinococcus alpinitundrae]|uniref:helix-turn-helix domain-containing protein n=1 Tax=Deinococcus alpinitundrae TaxID=468913 RepID=UPI00137A4973|nr:helix-turn-helix domain-containing protein [Deinococcus alpinitundrae]